MKKMLAFLMSALMVCSLMTGCASKGGDTPADTADNSTSQTEETTQGRDLKDLKIGAFSNSTITDGGYTQAFNTSLETIKANYGLSDDQVILVENVYDGTPDVQNIIQQLINEGCNVIIGHSNGYNEDLDVFAQ